MQSYFYFIVTQNHPFSTYSKFSWFVLVEKKNLFFRKLGILTTWMIAQNLLKGFAWTDSQKQTQIFPKGKILKKAFHPAFINISKNYRKLRSCL